MAKLVLTNPYIEIDGADLSDHISSVNIGTTYDLFETTQMGDIAKKFVGGLENNVFDLEIQQDFAVGEVEDIIYPNRGLLVNCVVRPTTAATSATNPQYSFQVLVSEWTPLSGQVGSMSTITAQWPIYGAITKTI